MSKFVEGKARGTEFCMQARVVTSQPGREADSLEWQVTFSRGQRSSLMPALLPQPYLRLSATGVKAGLDPEGAADFLGSAAPAAQVYLGPPQWGQRLGRDQDLEVRAGAAHVHGHN